MAGSNPLIVLRRKRPMAGLDPATHILLDRAGLTTSLQGESPGKGF